MSSNDPKQPDRDPSEAKLEAISLMRFLPPGSADIGADVTREELREAGVGAWSAPCDRRDDLRGVATPPSSPEDPRAMEDFDEVLPLEAEEDEDTEIEGDVIALRFSAS